MEEEKIDIYEPEIVSQKPLDIDYNDDNFEDITKGGLIHTRLNEAVIIQRIAKDLYKNPSSGMRELYNNAARACRIAQKEYHNNAFVKITIDKANRHLTIEDIDATGLSIKRFKQVLLELGTSDNLDSHEVGQFGMGFASYTTLSSALILESKSRVKDSKGNYQNYRMVAKDGMSFQPVGDSTLTKFGTRLSMTMYEEVAIDDLIKVIKKLVRFSGIKTVLELKNYESDDYYAEADRGDSELIFASDTIQNVMETLAADEAGVIRFDTEDFEFVATVSGKKPSSELSYQEVLVVGTPVESKLNFPFDYWILNIKNERKYKPMPDRDRMSEKADEELGDIMFDMLKNHFAQLGLLNYSHLKESPMKHEFLWCCRTRDEEYTPERVYPLTKNLSFGVRTAAGGKEAGHHSIYELLGNYEHIVYMRSNTKSAVAKIKNIYENVFCFSFTKGKKSQDWETHLETLTDFGVRTSSDIFKEHRIKIIHEKRELGDMDIVVHLNTGDGYKKEHLDPEEIDEMTMMVDEGNTNEVISIVRKGNCPFKVIRYIRELKDTDVRLWSEYLEELPNIVVATNKGAMTIKEFHDDSRTKFICTDFDPEFEQLSYRTDDLVMVSTDQFFAYRTHCFEQVKGTLDEYDNPVPWDCNYLDISTLIENVSHVGLSDSRHQKFFNKHYDEIPQCHWELFARFLYNVSAFNTYYASDENETKLTSKFEEYLALVKSFPRFDKSTDYQNVKYLEQLRDGFGEANTARQVIQKLMDDTIKKIQDNDYVFTKSIKKLVLPKLFNDFKVKYLKLEEGYSYQRKKVKVTISTKDKEIVAQNSFEVYSWHVTVEIIKVIREGDYNTVTMEIEF